MTSQKGIVVKIKDSYCIVVTPEGVYKKVKNTAKTPVLGAEISFTERNRSSYLKPIAFAAASVLLCLFLVLSQVKLIPEPEIYVSLDINPSLELTLDSSLSVINVESYNMDGKALTEKLPIKGESLNEAIQTIYKAAIQQHYLSQEKEGLILAGVSGKPGSVQDKAATELTKALTKAEISTKVKSTHVVYRFDDSFRKTAQQQGLTAGKYLLLRQARFKQGNVLIKDIKSQNVGQILFSYELQLLPNDTVIVLNEENFVPSGTTVDELIKKALKDGQNTYEKPSSEDTPTGPPEDTETTTSKEGAHQNGSINQNRNQKQSQIKKGTSGSPDSGNPTSGNPDSGNPGSGNPDSGNPDSGNPGSGNLDSGNPDSGNPDSGNPDSGNPDSANPDSGNPDSGNPDSGNPDSGNPDSGNPDSGNPDSGNPTPGNPDSGNPTPGNPTPGNPTPGNKNENHINLDSAGQIPAGSEYGGNSKGGTLKIRGIRLTESL